MKTYFLLPVYNEAQNLPRLLATLADIARVIGVEHRVLAVNDGSSDNTPAVLQELAHHHPLVIAHHEINQGPGKAFCTGFDEILRQADADDLIITMDADNTHSTKTVGMIVAELKDGYEMVIASVFAPGGMMIGVPFFRYILTLGCNFLYRVLFPVRGIREYTGFYRGYRVDSLRMAREKLGGALITRKGFGSMAELLIRLRQVPVFMKEVPMFVRYDQKGGKSKMKIFATISEHLGIIFGNVFRRRVL